MNQQAYDAIKQAWKLTVKTRALCPVADASAIGIKGYISPRWYQNHGEVYRVNLSNPLTAEDVEELGQIGAFVNRSFVIMMAAVLEANGVVPYRTDPDRTKPGGDHAQLTKWLRNRFAHGAWGYDDGIDSHKETWDLLKALFPNDAGDTPRFVLSIGKILEPLKDGVLDYVRSAT